MASAPAVITPCLEAQTSHRQMMMQLTMMSGIYGPRILAHLVQVGRQKPVRNRHEGGDGQREDHNAQVGFQEIADQADHDVGAQQYKKNRSPP